jgi:hypothetical protein
VSFARFLSASIHDHGMSAGLAAPTELVSQLMAQFEWALVIGCLASDSCAGYQPLRAAGKPVLMIEFGDEGDVATVCPAAAGLGFDALIKQPSLGAFRIPCPG